MDIKTAKAVRERFFDEFSAYHRRWLRELVAKYKERGEYPVYPTQIIEYYPEREDKEVAAFAALCMKWNNGKEIEQIADMRRIMGDHPAQWLRDRGYVVLSIGREQDKRIEGYTLGRYWKVAKVFDLLYDECFSRGRRMLPSEVFKGGRFKEFCRNAGVLCELPDMDYKCSMIELVLRTRDGMGRGLWPYRSSLKCPETDDIKRYLKQWFPYYRPGMWTFDEAVRLFDLEHDYDFYYAWLAHNELAKINPKACRQYIQRYHSRWALGRTFRGIDWSVKDRGMIPDINF